MTLDINTLLVATVANIVILALVTPLIMGARLGPAARAARWSVGVHALAWVFMILSNLWPETWKDRSLSTLSLTSFALTHWLMFRALTHWLGPRPLAGLVHGLTVLIPAGYFLVFNHYALRVGWSNGLLALQLTTVAIACLQPRTAVQGRWRLVVAFATLTMAVLTLGRGYLGAFTEHYPSFLTPHPWNITAMFMTNLMPLLVYFALMGGWHEEAEVALHEQAVTDALTGLLNRRGWQEAAGDTLRQADHAQTPLGLIMLDIDWFKQINDSQGHEAGDRALQAMAALLAQERRTADVAARIGGEEFCLLLPGMDAAAACHFDLRLRQQRPALERQLGHALNFSGGLALRLPGEPLNRLMQRADAALYQAKQNGRGHLVVAQAPYAPSPPLHPVHPTASAAEIM